MSETNYPAMWYHIPKKWLLQTHFSWAQIMSCLTILFINVFCLTGNKFSIPVRTKCLLLGRYYPSLLHTSNALLLLLFLWFAQVINVILNNDGWGPPKTKIFHILPSSLKFLHQFLCNLYSYCDTELLFLNKFPQFSCAQIVRIGSHFIVLLWYSLYQLSSPLNSTCLLLAGILSHLNAQFHCFSYYMLHLIHSKHKKSENKKYKFRMNQYTHAHFAKYCLFICTLLYSPSFLINLFS